MLSASASLGACGHLRPCKFPCLQVCFLVLQAFASLWQSVDFVNRRMGKKFPATSLRFPPKSCGFPDAETAAKIPAWAMPDDGASGGQAVGVAVGTLPKKPFRCVFDSFGNGALSGPACFDVGQRGAAPLRQTVPGPESTPSLSIKAHTV